MPFKPSTAKKYARLILQWMLPIAFALIVLNGCYRSLIESRANLTIFEHLYFMYSWIILVAFVSYLLFLVTLWAFSDDK